MFFIFGVKIKIMKLIIKINNAGLFRLVKFEYILVCLKKDRNFLMKIMNVSAIKSFCYLANVL